MEGAVPGNNPCLQANTLDTAVLSLAYMIIDCAPVHVHVDEVETRGIVQSLDVVTIPTPLHKYISAMYMYNTINHDCALYYAFPSTNLMGRTL